MTPPGTRFTLEVSPTLPPQLARLADLADDLWYAWDRPTRDLFARLDLDLWRAVGHSPKALIRQVDEQRLAAAAEDPVYLTNYSRVLSAYDTYLGRTTRRPNGDKLASDDLIAYFCAEFGFHESLPIYSGGLGILAGDHCKAASDARLPFIGVGLLYRQGYFSQTIDHEGNQLATYNDSEFEALPVRPALDADGRQVHVTVEMPARDVAVKVWRARVGHVSLLLLDTDVPQNSEADRAIAHRLYGGNRQTRIEQEIVLGVGGVRALVALGHAPTVWHINEGHAAFLVLERIRKRMAEGHDFATALEAVAVNTVFTTHTAVPAGHDHFADDMLASYFEGWCGATGVPMPALLALGHTPQGHEFNMTALAIRGSRHHNAVSAIHENVSDRMLAELWPQIDPPENPIDHVTNGVHVLTFLAPEWHDIFDRFLGNDWSQRLNDRDYWNSVEKIPDTMFWGVREYLKAQMLSLVRQRVTTQLLRNRGSESHLDRLFKYADPANPKVLTIGFGRRFATYKRSTLLFTNLDELREITCNPERPVLFIFAGKAHPADEPGQDMIRQIMRVAKEPRFTGHILFVEGYDLRLARRLLAGVDVWLNNPVYPLEASGTSGMKAAMNGAINLSVLDGWWDEGYDGTNGWAIKPASERADPAARDADEARTLYEILQDQVVPMYYDRHGLAYSPAWVKMAKRSVATILPQYNASRMLNDYANRFYGPAARRGRTYFADGCAAARDVAHWKARVREAWPGVALEAHLPPATRLTFGERARFEARVALNGLAVDDVAVELVMQPRRGESESPVQHVRFLPEGGADGGWQRYVLDLAPEHCGKFDVRIRAYPSHTLLTHPFELGLMLWA
ncbi:MAG TPA: alpha-glucan family phosphorylase [Casimicrobiaceae bacterium]|nr:alpha-glucan family phosphorylase [Casimicrobiaceae bacterium]